ncbi:MAG: peptidoglycan editing factor PgeF [Candidatus Eremiobacteraeota bacterium]|nr:peptidoglycan editing factor PgeF [Candidatus Eremiobacteraeota bacterium]
MPEAHEGCHFREQDGVKYLVFDSIEKSGLVTHGYTTRIGGVSGGPFSSLNPGLTSGDERENVLKNRHIIAGALGIYPEESLILEHGSKVYVAGDGAAGDKAGADAVITDRPGVALVILYADCVPVFILDMKTPSIALIHAGWRSTAGLVVRETLRKMKELYGTEGCHCLAAIAPSIGPCCFLVDDDVARVFLGTFGERKDLIRETSNKWSIDLWKLNEWQLLQEGVPGVNISTARLCSSCMPELFYSYRRDRRITGRMAALITLKGKRSNP